jgi:hypothetical protein
MDQLAKLTTDLDLSRYLDKFFWEYQIIDIYLEYSLAHGDL